MYAIIYIDPTSSEPVASFGPYDSSEDVEDAFDSIREDAPFPNGWARTVALTGFC